MCLSALVLPHGFTKEVYEVYYICSALVLPHHFKNKVCYMTA